MGQGQFGSRARPMAKLTRRFLPGAFVYPPAHLRWQSQGKCHASRFAYFVLPAREGKVNQVVAIAADGC